MRSYNHIEIKSTFKNTHLSPKNVGSVVNHTIRVPEQRIKKTMGPQF